MKIKISELKKIKRSHKVLKELEHMAQQDKKTGCSDLAEAIATAYYAVQYDDSQEKSCMHVSKAMDKALSSWGFKQ
mgnify:FL=1